VPAFNLFCYIRGDKDGRYDQRRPGIALWRLEDAVRWAVHRGYDSILIERVGETQYDRD
jgi:hypothetical protein